LSCITTEGKNLSQSSATAFVASNDTFLWGDRELPSPPKINKANNLELSSAWFLIIMISYWKIKICCCKRKMLLITSHCHRSLKATPHFWALTQNLHRSPCPALQRSISFDSWRVPKRWFQRQYLAKTCSPERKSTHRHVGSANTKATCKIWLHHQTMCNLLFIIIMELLYYVLVTMDSKKLLTLCARIPLRKKSTISKMLPSTQKHLFMYSNFPVPGTDTSTYCPTRVYHSQENLNANIYTGEIGDCQGDPQRPEEGNEAEKRGCGCGRVVLWNRMRWKMEMRKWQIPGFKKLSIATGIKKGENMLNRVLGGCRWRMEIQSGETETGRMRWVGTVTQRDWWARSYGMGDDGGDLW